MLNREYYQLLKGTSKNYFFHRRARKGRRVLIVKYDNFFSSLLCVFVRYIFLSF